MRYPKAFFIPPNVSRHAKASPFLGNGDDCRQRRKQGGAVGAAASRMQATAKQTLGAATRPVARRRRDGEVYFFLGNMFCGGMYEPLRRISKWQWLPVERPVLPR